MKKLSFFLNLLRILPAYLIANINRRTSEMVKSDIRFWKEILNWQDKSDLYVFGILLCQKKEFRFLIRKRIHIGGGSIPSFLFRVLFKPMDTLYINTEHIGSGLYIQHGFATIIAAESIGDNCWINQQVTIGYEQNRRPVIGNHVRICCGAIIVGDVHVGDNSIIASGAVVTKDVPTNEIWGGTPARFIKKVKGSSFDDQS